MASARHSAAGRFAHRAQVCIRFDYFNKGRQMLSARHLSLHLFACFVIAIAAGLLVTGWANAQEESDVATTEDQPIEGQPTEGEQTQVDPKELVAKGEAALKEGNFQEALNIYEQLAQAVERAQQLEYQARVL